MYMDNFETLTVDILDKRVKIRSFFREHGHEDNIKRSYEMVRKNAKQTPGCSVAYVWETGELFLKTREALENVQKITLQPFDESRLG